MSDFSILVGEASGDAHGAHLLKELLKIDPQLQISAVSGPQMRKYPIKTLFPMEKLQVMGFIDVFKAFPRILQLFFQLRNALLLENPQIILMIDYAEFHMRLAKSLRKKGFQGKIIQYIAPTVWAWRLHRRNILAKYFDQLFTIFPFETKWFPMDVSYVGHPLSYQANLEPLPREEKKLLALFPGSRLSEIEKNLTLQLQTASELFQIDPQMTVGLSISHERFLPLIQKIIQKTAPHLPIQLYFPEERETLFASATLSLAKSGTIALELALHKIPTIVHFAIRPLDVWIAQKIAKINLRFYCIVNILLEKEVFPELYGPNFTQDNLTFMARLFWQSKSLRDQTASLCSQLGPLLGTQNPSATIASHMKQALKK
jgi:lipid-A-disaccharide synthase